jgi:predicted ribosomally synthesized peptide with nif11-like leader
MSKITADKWLEIVSQDANLQEKIKVANTPDIIIQIAAEQGYEVSEKELKATLEEVQNLKEHAELNEVELEVVAGGRMTTYSPAACEMLKTVLCG